VFGQLAKLRGGNVVIEDDTGSHRFGAETELVGRVRVRSGDFYRKVALGGSLGAVEAWVDGSWDSDDLSTTLRVFARDVARSEAMEQG